MSVPKRSAAATRKTKEIMKKINLVNRLKEVGSDEIGKVYLKPDKNYLASVIDAEDYNAVQSQLKADLDGLVNPSSSSCKT